MDDLDIVGTVGFLNSSFLHETTKRLSELKNEFNKTAGSFVILYINNELSEREIKKTTPFTIAPKKKPAVNLTKDLKDLHTENCKDIDERN